jgi:hypothetical protein
MDKKSSTEYGIHTDPKLLLLLWEESPIFILYQELKFYISVPLQGQLYHMFPISSVLKELYMLSNFLTDLEEI